MDSYTRTMKTIQREETDRVPVIPLIIQYALDITSVSHREYSSNPEKMAEAQINCLYRHGLDGIHITTDNQIISEAMGCRIYLPPDEPPQYKTRILSNSKDLSIIHDVDPNSLGRMPVIINATRIAREQLNNSYFIKTNCDSAPFSVAAALRGEEQFFMDLYDDPQFVFDVIEKCAEVVTAYGKAIASSGAHALTFGDSTAGLIGRDFYKKYVLPFTKQVVSELKESGLPIFYHVCGDTTAILDLMSETGADVLEVDYMVDLRKARELAGRNIILEGNINPTGVLLYGTPDKVYEESILCIKRSGNRGFILSSGCEVPRMTPRANIDMMVKASKDLGYGNLEKGL